MKSFTLQVFKDSLTDLGQSRGYKCKGKEGIPCYAGV